MIVNDALCLEIVPLLGRGVVVAGWVIAALELAPVALAGILEIEDEEEAARTIVVEGAEEEIAVNDTITLDALETAELTGNWEAADPAELITVKELEYAVALNSKEVRENYDSRVDWWFTYVLPLSVG